MNRGKVLWIVTFVIIFGFTSCDMGIGNDNQQINQNLPVFDIDLMEDNILDTFTGGSIGFTYAIAVQGTLERSGAAGQKSQAPDANVNLSVNDKFHVASISKTVTTIAALMMLEETPGVGLDTTIDGYLPSSWTQGPGLDGVTFRELLTHESGFDHPDQSRYFDRDLQNLVAAGTPNSGPEYSNANHNFIRVLLPYVIGANKNIGESDEDFHERIFGQYLYTKVLQPRGIDLRISPPANPVLYYSFPSDGSVGLGGAGDTNWEFSYEFGAYGLYLSVIDILNIMSYLHFGGESDGYLSDEMLEEMNTDEMGYWNSRNGDKGRYLMKQGSWRYTNGNNNLQGVQTIVAHYPDGVQAAVFVNSTPANPYNMASLMRDIYDSSFVDP
ncbi:MAG: beta-lactamase family protein [Spirochaetales bacterium]|nr:beta-lactamase family protein [Spirochaetales bacterium]